MSIIYFQIFKILDFLKIKKEEYINYLPYDFKRIMGHSDDNSKLDFTYYNSKKDMTKKLKEIAKHKKCHWSTPKSIRKMCTNYEYLLCKI